MTVADIALAVPEAATNSVVHAFVDAEPGTLCIAVEALHGALRVVVADDGNGRTPRPDSPGLGLGLPTIVHLTESFDVREGPGGRGTEVRMVFAAPDVRAPAPPAGDLLDDIAALIAAGWRPGVDDLTRLLVPRLADACTIDLVEHGGPRRIAARVDTSHPLCTACCVTVQPDSGAISVSCAGHPPPIRLTATGAEHIAGNGPRLGAVPSSSWGAADGMATPQEVVRRLERALDEFRVGPDRDDIAVLVLRRR